jgi:hypothetical protein
MTWPPSLNITEQKVKYFKPKTHPSGDLVIYGRNGLFLLLLRNVNQLCSTSTNNPQVFLNVKEHNN